MNDAPPGPGRPRRAFIEAPPRVPFFKTREGALIGVFGLLFLIACILLYVQYRKTQARIQQAEAQRVEAQRETKALEAVPLAERLAEKRAQLESSYEGGFADTQNGDGFVETPGYAKLIEILAGMTPEETERAAHRYLADHAKVIEEPDLYRGEFVRIRGLVGGIFAVKLDRPVHDVTDVWRGSITQFDGNEGVTFDFIGEPPPFEVRRSVVELDGLLYRTVRFENRNGKTQTAPYLLARSLRVVQEQSTEGRTTKFWATAMGIAAIIGYLVLRSILRSQRRAQQPTRLKAILQERLRNPRG